MKVVTVVGTRPEIIRLSRVITMLDTHCEHHLVHTGQNYDYELNRIFFDELDIRAPDHYLDSAAGTLGQTVGNIIARAYDYLAAEQPDALLVLGDTNSAMAAYAAKRLKIPVFHMEAGNRCYDERVPEEINRRIIDHISDVNLPYSGIARDNLLREGLPPDRVIKTGSPMYEVLDHYRPLIDASSVLDRLRLTAGDYFVASCHREENVDDPERLRAFAAMLNAVAVQYEKRIILSTHPRTRSRLDAACPDLAVLVETHKPFGFPDYIKLQQHSLAVLSDSGTITEEASILGFAALNIRDAHERMEGMEEGAVMMTGIDADTVLAGLSILLEPGRAGSPALQPVADYQAKQVSEKILRIVLGYTRYVNRRVWGKDLA